MDASTCAVVDETSVDYGCWRIVAVCFVVATFGWGFGFYGQGVYLAELHRLHGWPTSLISSATTFFHLFGAALVVFISEAVMVLIAACALFGLSVGNLITLPSLIVQREFDPRAFGVLVSPITAINQITYAFGQGIIGLLRDTSGGYALPGERGSSG